MAASPATQNPSTTAPAVWAFEVLPIPMAVLDVDLAILEANRAFAELMDVPAASLIHEPFGKRVRAVALEAPEGEGVQTFLFQCADGPRWLRLDLQAVQDRVLAMLVDVTGERAVLERMKADSAGRGRLMHDAEVGVWRFDPEAQLYHFPTELALGHDNIQEPVPVANLRMIQHPDDVAIDDAIRERLTREEGSAEADMRYRTGDGGWRHLRVLYRSGRKLKSGLYEMYGLSQNVTDLAQARDDARDSAGRLKLALAAAHAGVFGYDYAKGEYWMSREVRDLLGHAAAEAASGDDPRIVFHPDDRAAVVAMGAESARVGQAVSQEARIQREDGPLWVRVYWQTECDGAGALVRGVGLLLDIDEQKRQEIALTEARQLAESATASKSSFLASVSHEIRTPMNGIVGVLNLLKRDNLTDEGRDLLGEALACSDMLAQLIDDVLDFSKMEAGKLDVTPAPTDPAAVMGSVVALLQPQAEAKTLYLRAVGPSAAAGDANWAMIDPIRLRQCLFNVIGNAVKFTESGGVEVRMAYLDGATRQLRVEVQDTGVGVPDHAKAALFDRFQQAHSGSDRKFGGTGLGLAISRSLARMMGGEMGFESAEGKGSTFWFEISAPAAQAAAAPAVEADAAPLTGLTVLIVDDNRTNRLVGLKTLEALGAAAETADSGEAAIAAAATGAYDLILMDVNMPGMDGLEATRLIRELDGPEARVPIVALTADVMTHHQAAYHAAGMNGFVPKPFAPAQLLAEVVRVAGPDRPQ